MPELEVDRREFVRRHNPVLTSAHPTGVLTVGNGDIALSVDVSGLQTFPAFHELRPYADRVVGDGLTELPEQPAREFDPDDFQIPLRTQSTWGWYRTRSSRPFDPSEAVTLYDTARGPIPYADRMGIQRPSDPIAEEFEAGAWFHYNPRRAHLGRLTLLRPDGSAPEDPTVLRDIRTELDLWTGTVRAQYLLEGVPVVVTTVGHPVDHTFAVRVDTELVRRGWSVAWVFDDQPDDLAPFELPLEQSVTWTHAAPGCWEAVRTVEDTVYSVCVETTGDLREVPNGATASSHSEATLEVVVRLRAGRTPAGGERGFDQVREASARAWESHWRHGALVGFGGSDDERSGELERRVVLSQYLTAVSAGAAPTAETGLIYNTWSGKFHLEMHWWHAAHFPMWGRGHLLERSLDWYHGALGDAVDTAARQGYRGARWPKQTDPSATESPSNIGVFLVWQQPHIIHLLELLRGEGADEGFVRTHYPLVEATAEFMADFVEEREGSFVLPPPLIPAQESYLAHRRTNTDPTFELAYWSWALRVANEWRRALGLDIRSDWERVASSMSRPAVLEDGTYAAIATPPHLIRKDHPSMLMAFGLLPPGDIIDPEIMDRTLDAVWDRWDLQSSWGWDYPVISMTAARLGDIGRALDALLLSSPKNHFLPNGHNPQMPGFLSLYLPANGGLLAAVAHICAAIERGADVPPGWRVSYDGLTGIPEQSLPVTP